MGTYIYSVLCAALCVSVLCSLAPEREGMSKYIAFAGSLAVVLCILYPVAVGSDMPELPHFSERDEEKVSESESAAAEYTARNAILSFCAMSGVDCDSVSADIEFSESGTHVTLKCSEHIIGDAENLESHLEEVMDVYVTVCVGGE